jgi:hypothetical protein
MYEIIYDHEDVEYTSSAYQRILQALSVMENLENVRECFCGIKLPF